MSRDRKTRPGKTRQGPAVITEAEASPQQQLRSRETRYLLMMGLRVLCLLAAVVAYYVYWPLMFVFLVGMILLPWMAVLIANDRPPIKPSMYRRFRGRPDAERAIEARPHRVIDE